MYKQFIKKEKKILLVIVLVQLFFAVPNSHAQVAVVTEKIIYAVNDDYVQLNPQWKTGAQDIVDYVNGVLAKNTNKRYEIKEFRTFDIAKWNQLAGDASYHYDNGFGGTTIFHWVETPNTKIKPDVHYSKLINVTSFNYLGGMPYQQLFLVDSHYEYTPLLGRSQKTFETTMVVPLHELGHTMGLSVPDWYLYQLEDVSGVKPQLPSFDLRAQYPNDPMSSLENLPYRFSDFNAAIINKNLRHEKTYLEISKITSSQIKVIVEDEAGQKISNATVQVFGGKKGCWYCQKIVSNPLIETQTTSILGEALIAAPSTEWTLNQDMNSKYIGFIVKASAGDLRGGAYVIGQQMQQHKFLTGDDIFTLTIRLNSVDRDNNKQDLAKDSDGDGLSDVEEERLGTNPKNKDTDGDGYPDGLEVRTGHNPLKPPNNLVTKKVVTKLLKRGSKGNEVKKTSTGAER